MLLLYLLRQSCQQDVPQINSRQHENFSLQLSVPTVLPGHSPASLGVSRLEVVQCHPAPSDRGFSLLSPLCGERGGFWGSFCRVQVLHNISYNWEQLRINWKIFHERTFAAFSFYLNGGCECVDILSLTCGRQLTIVWRRQLIWILDRETLNNGSSPALLLLTQAVLQLLLTVGVLLFLLHHLLRTRNISLSAWQSRSGPLAKPAPALLLVAVSK